MRRALDVFTFAAIFFCLFAGIAAAFREDGGPTAILLLSLALVNFLLFLWRKKTEHDVEVSRKANEEIQALIEQIRSANRSS